MVSAAREVHQPRGGGLAQTARPVNTGRRLTLFEELQQKKLNPVSQKKPEKQETKKIGMNSILDQLELRRQALDEGGNIIKKAQAIDEDSEQESSDSDQFD